jgi:hypothetical protein
MATPIFRLLFVDDTLNLTSTMPWPGECRKINHPPPATSAIDIDKGTAHRLDLWRSLPPSMTCTLQGTLPCEMGAHPQYPLTRPFIWLSFASSDDCFTRSTSCRNNFQHLLTKDGALGAGVSHTGPMWALLVKYTASHTRRISTLPIAGGRDNCHRGIIRSLVAGFEVAAQSIRLNS